jgi:[ribosomal protein S5]-alanine N-acetyltransferase
VDVVDEAEHPTGTNTIGGMRTAERERVEPVATAAGGLALTGPTLHLRYPAAGDAAALFELASDPAVTRYFSWGPYERVEEAEAYIAGLPERREGGELLDLLVVHRDDGPVGITGLSGLSARDRRAVLGSWFGHRHWGSGANRESKALMTHLAFEHLGLERLTAYAASQNTRSQRALERLGFRREGVLAAWHRHGDRVYDVVSYGMVRAAWERSTLPRVPAEVRGEPPAAFVVA